jgi:hypothetical protein
MIVTHHNFTSYKYLDYNNYKYISWDKHPIITTSRYFYCCQSQERARRHETQHS